MPDQTPSRRDEVSKRPGTLVSAISFHGQSVIGSKFLLKDKIRKSATFDRTPTRSCRPQDSARYFQALCLHALPLFHRPFLERGVIQTSQLRDRLGGGLERLPKRSLPRDPQGQRF